MDKTKFDSIFKIVSISFGVICVLLAVFADQFSLGGTMKSASFGKAQWISLTVGMIIIIMSMAHQEISRRIAVFIITVIPSLWIVDNALYFLSPYLTAKQIFYLSDEANIRWETRHMKSAIQESKKEYVLNDQNIYFYNGKPNEGRFDELGYRNPKGYLNQKNIDILLFGDSIIESIGSEKSIADYLREETKLKVYSLAISGQGIGQWKEHFKRFISHHRAAPEIVILNYFSGNDIADTIQYYLFEKYKNHYALSFFREITHLFQYALFYKFTPSHENVNQETFPQEERPYILREIFLSPDNIIVKEVLRQTVHEIKAFDNDIEIIVANIPTTYSIYYGPEVAKANAQTLEVWGKELGFNTIDATDHLKAVLANNQIYQNKDFHFNEKGCEMYAKFLSQEINKIRTNSQ